MPETESRNGLTEPLSDGWVVAILLFVAYIALGLPMAWWATAITWLVLWGLMCVVVIRWRRTVNLRGPAKFIVCFSIGIVFYLGGIGGVRDQYRQAHPLPTPQAATVDDEKRLEAHIRALFQQQQSQSGEQNKKTLTDIQDQLTALRELIGRNPQTAVSELKQNALQLSKEILAYYQSVSLEERDWWTEAHGQEVSNIEKRIWEEQHSEADEQTLQLEENKEDAFLDEYQKRFSQRIVALQGQLAAHGQAKWNVPQREMLHPPNASFLPMIAGDIANQANSLK